MAVGAGKVFTSNGREAKVSVVDPKTLATTTKIDSGGANPDAITFDAKRNEVWVFNHTGQSASQINAATNAVVATIPLTGTAETGQSDGAGKVYVNIEDKDQIDVIDVAAKKVSASWSVAPGSGPTGMALDNARHRLFDELENSNDPLFDLVPATHVNLVRTADGITDVGFVVVERFVEFPQKKSFFGGLGIEQGDRIDVTVSHSEDEIRLLNQIRGEHAAALAGNIDAQFFEGMDRISARGQAIHGPDPGRQHPEIVPSLDRGAEQSFGHWAAANISRANEKNRLHSLINRSNLRRSRPIVNGEIKSRETVGRLTIL
jgi:hypothetical protein